MNVKELKELLNKQPDEAIVMVVRMAEYGSYWAIAEEEDIVFDDPNKVVPNTDDLPF